MTTKHYFAFPDDDGWAIQNPYELSARRRCGLPGVRCDVCNATWATVGLLYPSVSCHSINDIVGTSVSPVPVDQLLEIKAAVSKRVGDTTLLLGPGAAFGPLVGTVLVKKGMGDFMWLNPWTPLLTDRALESLKARGIQLTAIKAELVSRGGADGSLLEIEARPAAELAMVDCGGMTPCSRCGRTALHLPESPPIAASTIALGRHVQRVVRAPTLLLVNEAFRDACGEARLTNIAFRPATALADV